MQTITGGFLSQEVQQQQQLRKLPLCNLARGSTTNQEMDADLKTSPAVYKLKNKLFQFIYSVQFSRVEFQLKTFANVWETWDYREQTVLHMLFS